MRENIFFSFFKMTLKTNFKLESRFVKILLDKIQIQID
jgi:hypothetical protein